MSLPSIPSELLRRNPLAPFFTLVFFRAAIPQISPFLLFPNANIPTAHSHPGRSCISRSSAPRTTDGAHKKNPARRRRVHPTTQPTPSQKHKILGPPRAVPALPSLIDGAHARYPKRIKHDAAVQVRVQLALVGGAQARLRLLGAQCPQVRGLRRRRAAQGAPW